MLLCFCGDGFPPPPAFQPRRRYAVAMGDVYVSPCLILLTVAAATKLRLAVEVQGDVREKKNPSSPCIARYSLIEIRALIGEKMLIWTFLLIENLKTCFVFMLASAAMHFRTIVLQ